MVYPSRNFLYNGLTKGKTQPIIYSPSSLKVSVSSDANPDSFLTGPSHGLVGEKGEHLHVPLPLLFPLLPVASKEAGLDGMNGKARFILGLCYTDLYFGSRKYYDEK